MNLTRLMVLGTLARHGPTHGHQVRRLAEVSNVGEWGGVSVGALYRELRVMEGEGLVEAVRTEQVGRRPARTVYAITDDGRLELGALRERALRSTHHGIDPLGVALTFAFDDAAAADIKAALDARRARIALSREELLDARERGLARGYLTDMDAVVMRRGVLHLDSELRWHDELAATISARLRNAADEADKTAGASDLEAVDNT